MLTLGKTVFQIYSCTHFPYSFLVGKKKKKQHQNGHLKNSNQSCHTQLHNFIRTRLLQVGEWCGYGGRRSIQCEFQKNQQDWERPRVKAKKKSINQLWSLLIELIAPQLLFLPLLSPKTGSHLFTYRYISCILIYTLVVPLQCSSILLCILCTFPSPTLLDENLHPFPLGIKHTVLYLVIS